MAGSDPLFTSSTLTSSTTFNNSSVPLANGAWGEVEDDPEMRCDDDFLDFLNTHQHHSYIGPSAPALFCSTTAPVVGRVEPATGNITKLAYGPLSTTEDYYLPTRETPPSFGGDWARGGDNEADNEVEHVLCGWECPRCKLCLSPHVDACERCAPAWP